MFSDLAQKLIRLLLKKISRVGKTAFYACRKAIWGKYFLNLLLFQTLSQIFAKFFQTSGKITSAGLSKLLSTSPEEQFESITFSGRNMISRIFLDIARKLFGIWAIKNWQSCRNSILRVLSNIFREKIMIDSWSGVINDRTVVEKTSVRLSKKTSKSAREHFEENNFSSRNMIWECFWISRENSLDFGQESFDRVVDAAFYVSEDHFEENFCSGKNMTPRKVLDLARKLFRLWARNNCQSYRKYILLVPTKNWNEKKRCLKNQNFLNVFGSCAKSDRTFDNKISAKLSKLHSTCPQKPFDVITFLNLLFFQIHFQIFVNIFFQTFDKITCSGMLKLLSRSPEDRFENFVWNKHKWKRNLTGLGKMISTNPNPTFKEINDCFPISRIICSYIRQEDFSRFVKLHFRCPEEIFEDSFRLIITLMNFLDFVRKLLGHLSKTLQQGCQNCIKNKYTCG